MKITGLKKVLLVLGQMTGAHREDCIYFPNDMVFFVFFSPLIFM